MKLKFSIPYNGDLTLMAWAFKTGQAAEVYFAGAGRNDHSSPYQNQNKFQEEEILELMALCRKHNVKSNLLMNKGIAFTDNLKSVFHYIGSLDKTEGLTSITVGDPAIVPFLKKAFPRIRLQTSVFMNIDSLQKIKEALKMGVTDFCLDVSTNRKGEELEKIRDYKNKLKNFSVKLLANHGCYMNCFYSMRHSSWPLLKEMLEQQTAAQRPPQKRYILGDLIDVKNCVYKKEDVTDEIKRPFIRPEDLTYYEKGGLADVIKIAYRMDRTPVLRKKLKAYFERSFDGDLFELTPPNKGAIPFICDNKSIPDTFAKKLLSCDMRCEGCDYCRLVAVKALKKKNYGRHLA
ncbi:MAG: hypothetical protein ACE14U_00795 [Candidatus Velamenicoccus archaeovorus]